MAGPALAVDRRPRGQRDYRPDLRQRHCAADPRRPGARRRTAAVMTRRAVVTGVGFVTPIGIGVEPVWERLHQSHSAVQVIDRFDSTPFRSHVAAQINDFDPVAMLSARQARRTDRCSQLALAATRLALADAAIDLAA